MEIINYSPLYQKQIVKLWNYTMEADLIDENRFIKLVLCDENFNPELVLLCIDKGEVIGFILGTKRMVPYMERGLEPDRGFISLIFVSKEYQHQGIGTKLMEEVEKRMIDKGTTNITIAAYSPNYFFPGVDEEAYPNGVKFFKKLGYEVTGEAVSMHRTLFNYRYPEAVKQKREELINRGCSLQPFSYEYSLELLEFLLNNFGSGWKRNAYLAILNHTAHDTIKIFFDENKRIVGYCQRAIDDNPARFGPFGVREDLRSNGMGSILFHEMLHDMLSKGIYHVYFLWTHGDAQRFYERQGMSPYRSYQLIKKNIK